MPRLRARPDVGQGGPRCIVALTTPNTSGRILSRYARIPLVDRTMHEFCSGLVAAVDVHDEMRARRSGTWACLEPGLALLAWADADR